MTNLMQAKIVLNFSQYFRIYEATIGFQCRSRWCWQSSQPGKNVIYIKWTRRRQQIWEQACKPRYSRSGTQKDQVLIHFPLMLEILVLGLFTHSFVCLLSNKLYCNCIVSYHRHHPPIISYCKLSHGYHSYRLLSRHKRNDIR